MGVEARRAVVRGLVQGVGFRHHTKVRARELGLVGFVRNLPDGSVEVWCEGEPARLEDLALWLRTGPSAARVDSVEVSAVDPRPHAAFVVLRESS